MGRSDDGCYPGGPPAGRGCFPEPRAADGCFSVGSVLRGLLLGAAAPDGRAAGKRLTDKLVPRPGRTRRSAR